MLSIDPEKRRLMKIRAALRNVWRYDYARRAVITQALDKEKKFTCPICKQKWESWAADVDHYPQLGGFSTLQQAGDWMVRLFTGSMRALCKSCHKKVTAEQRRKKQ